MASPWKWKHRVSAILPTGPSLLASVEERRTTDAAAEQNPRDIIISQVLSPHHKSQGLQLSVALDSFTGAPSTRTAMYLDARELSESALTQQILDWFIEHAASLNLDSIASTPTVIDSSVLLQMSPLNINLQLHFNLPLPSKTSSPSSPFSEALREWLSSPTSVHLTIRPLIALLLPKLGSVLAKQFPNELNPRWARRLANDRKSYTYLSKALNDIFSTFSPGSENWIDLQTIKRHLARLEEQVVEDESHSEGVIGGMMGLIAKRYGNPDPWKGRGGKGKGKERGDGLNKEMQGLDFLDRILDGSDVELDHHSEEDEEESFESLLPEEDEDHSDSILDDDRLMSVERADDDEDEQMDLMEMLDLFD